MIVRFLKWMGIAPSAKTKRAVKLGAPKEQHQKQADETLRALEFELHTHEWMPSASTRWFWE